MTKKENIGIVDLAKTEKKFSFIEKSATGDLWSRRKV